MSNWLIKKASQTVLDFYNTNIKDNTGYEDFISLGYGSIPTQGSETRSISESIHTFSNLEVLKIIHHKNGNVSLFIKNKNNMTGYITFWKNSISENNEIV